MTPRNHNAKNDRIKRDYLIWLREAKQRSQSTVEQCRRAIDRYERFIGFGDFVAFDRDQAIAFKRSLLDTKAGGNELSLSSVDHVLRALRDFLAWLSGQAFGRRVRHSEIAYLNLSLGEARQAKASGPKEYATLADYRKALFAMPTGTVFERRDQALLAMLLLTGARDAALVSLCLRHVDLNARRVYQDPRNVRTKAQKTIETFFFPVGEDVVEIVQRWSASLIEQGYGGNDALFPKTLVSPNPDGEFAPAGLSHDHWASAAPVRSVLRSAFARVGLPYRKPHSVRNTLTQLAYDLKLSPEQFKAWSQNLGHDQPLTTFNHYGIVRSERQAELLRALAASNEGPSMDQWEGALEAVSERMSDRIVGKVLKQLGESGIGTAKRNLE